LTAPCWHAVRAIFLARRLELSVPRRGFSGSVSQIRVNTARRLRVFYTSAVWTFSSPSAAALAAGLRSARSPCICNPLSAVALPRYGASAFCWTSRELMGCWL